MAVSEHPDQLLPDSILLESMGLALMAVDQRCRIIRLNSLAEELTGHLESGVKGCSCMQVMKASLCDVGCPMQQALQTGTTCQIGTVILQTADGGLLTVEMTASALFGPDGQVAGAVGLLRNLGQQPEQMRLYGSRIFVSRTPAMRRIFDALPQMASSEAPLLILGGPGSGRAAFAETIHSLSKCGSGRGLATVKCRSQGAEHDLTQARSTPQDSRGTLLLEDICDASPALQQQLMAWIEDSSEEVVYRLISTATADLELLVEQGIFRQNLYYRLNVLHLALPDLKQRRDDIPLVVNQLLEEMNLKRRKEVNGLTANAMRALLSADFSGNIRQLRQILDQAHRLCEGGVINQRHLTGVSGADQDAPAEDERTRIQEALKMAKGNLGRAAELMGIHRSTLWRKMKRLGIVSPARLSWPEG